MIFLLTDRLILKLLYRVSHVTWNSATSMRQLFHIVTNSFLSTAVAGFMLGGTFCTMLFQLQRLCASPTCKSGLWTITLTCSLGYILVQNNGSQPFFTNGTVKFFNVIVSTPDTKMDGSSLKLNKKAVNEIQFITHSFSVKRGTSAFCTYLEYWGELRQTLLLSMAQHWLCDLSNNCRVYTVHIMPYYCHA
jgi:hypothetical protein